jgi:hypothetical protein
MHVLQTTIEKLLYILLLMVFIATIVVGIIGYQDGQSIKANQRSNLVYIQDQLNEYQTLTRNGFICIFTAPSSVEADGKAAITNYLDKCYPNPQEIK